MAKRLGQAQLTLNTKALLDCAIRMDISRLSNVAFSRSCLFKVCYYDTMFPPRGLLIVFAEHSPLLPIKTRFLLCIRSNTRLFPLLLL